MKGSSLLLPGLGPLVQAPHRFCLHFLLHHPLFSLPALSTGSSAFLVYRHVDPELFRHQRVLLPDNERNGHFRMKHFPSSFHEDVRSLKQRRPSWPKELFKDAFTLYPTREPKRTVDVQSFNRPFDGSQGQPGNHPSLVTQFPIALERQFPSASVDQSKTRDLNARGNSDQITSATLEVVKPGSKDYCKAVRTVRTIPEDRRSRRVERSTSDHLAPSPNNGRPCPRFETSQTLGQQPVPSSSNRIGSSNANPNSSRPIEAGVQDNNIMSSKTVRSSPDGGARLLSTSHATLMSYGESGTRGEPAYTAVDQARSSRNGAHPALKNYRIPASRTVGSVGRQTSGLAKFHTPSRDVGGVTGNSVRQDTAQGNGRRHIHSVATTSEAIAVLQNRLQRGIRTDSSTYITVLQMCLQQKDLSAARQVHDCIIASGMDKNKYVACTLQNVYIKCGGLSDARRIFDKLEKKSIITWAMMITGYAKSDDAKSAVEVFNLMRQEGAQPDKVTYLCILKACAKPSALKWGKELHECIRLAGFESDVRVGTALLQMYAKCGCITEARRVFENLTSRNIVTWNTMIGACAESVHGLEAYRLFLQMRREGLKPDAFTCANILNASASAEALEWVKEVHAYASKAGLESDLRVGGALVRMYAESGTIDDARLVFDKMETRDVVTWNIMIDGLAQHGLAHEAYQRFLQMQQEGFKPDTFTYASILNAPASAGALEWVKLVHGHSSKAGLESHLRVGTALVHKYAESGSIDDARLVFDRMEKRNVVTWNVMIGGLAYHGCGLEALALFRKMNADLVRPDGTTFVAVLSACCHAGLLDDGRRLFSAMTRDYGMEPGIVHYTCMVDLLGRAGLLEEAKRFIIDMPLEPDVVIWTALLGACRSYGNVELGEFAAEEVFKLQPSGSGGYVLLSNIYAAAGKWEKVSLVRTMMQKRGIRKEPGRSWIEVDNKIHEFVVGDTSHPEAKAIYTELNKLTEKLKAQGYIPDTRLALHDINEEDREPAVCPHSERLAIAYGLMHVPRGEPILVWKNLRACPDCHTAIKFISKITGREIIARDLNRFHHFKDGACSCGDRIDQIESGVLLAGKLTIDSTHWHPRHNPVVLVCLTKGLHSKSITLESFLLQPSAIAVL